MWAEPFLDLSGELAKMTKVVIVDNIGIFTSNRSLEEEITCFAPPQTIRRYATSAVVTFRSTEDAKVLTSTNELLVDGRKWKVVAGERADEDPQEPDIYQNNNS